MGRMNAMAFAEAVSDGQVSLNAALVWHLRSNHYPPVPYAMLEPAQRAIELASDGLWDETVDMPAGIEHRIHGTSVPAGVLVGSLHLETFVQGGV